MSESYDKLFGVDYDAFIFRLRPQWRSELLMTPLLRFDRSIEPVHLGDSEFSLYCSIGFARKKGLS
jgi:hypothetical protein